jgi:hypothetical protein
MGTLLDWKQNPAGFASNQEEYPFHNNKQSTQQWMGSPHENETLRKSE